jgi:hypothetical protein
MSVIYTSILTTLVETMNDQLNADLIDLIFDDTKAGLVRFGELQDDPEKAKLNILIHRGDETWKDELKLDDIGISTPTYEIGGVDENGNIIGWKQWWWRRFTIELILFYPNQTDRDTQMNKSNIILQRVQRSLWDMTIPTDVDDFGEQANFMQIRDAYVDEGGGVGEFIWRGEVRVEFVTSITG